MSNDPQLEPLVESGAAEAEIERLLVEVAAPLVRKIVSRHFRSIGDIAEEADDVESAIKLRLLRRLRRVSSSPAEEIEDLERYIATLSYNVINDHLRRRFPERTRLKNRLRYVLTHDRRLSLWTAPAGLVAGLKEWNGGLAAVTAVPLDPAQATRAMRDRDHPGDALQALLDAVGTPVELDALVAHTAALWHVVDLATVDGEAIAEEQQSEPLQLERRELLHLLWREIVELRPMQRKALLLNLRDEETLALFIVTGIANFDAIAAALEMSPEALSGIWNDLPLDDLRIAALLGVTRQQVINLRKSARDRLRRRLRNNRAGERL